MKNIRLFSCILLLCLNSADSLLAQDDYSCSTSCNSCSDVDDEQSNVCNSSAEDESAVMRDHVAAFFASVPQELMAVTARIKELVVQGSCQESSIEKLRVYKKKLLFLDCVARRDVQALAQLSPSDLEWSGCDLYLQIDASRCHYTLQGRLVSFSFEAENALPFVVYHSALDMSVADKQTTCAMLKVLFDKGLKHAHGYYGYWVKNNAADTMALDYVGESSLKELAEYYGGKEVQDFVVKYCGIVA